MLVAVILSFFSLASRGDDSDLDLIGDESLEELLFFDTARDGNACIDSMLPNSDDVGVVNVLLLENENGSGGISSIVILSLVSLSIIISAFFNNVGLGFNLMLGRGLDERDSNLLLSIFSLPLSYLDFGDDDDIDAVDDDDEEGKKVGTSSIDTAWLN